MLGASRAGEIPRAHQKTVLIVNRTLAFVAAFAFAAAQPAVTLAAHPGAGALPRPAPPIGHPVAPGGFANQAPAQVPFHVNVQQLRIEPPQRMAPEHFTVFHPAAFTRPAPVYPYRGYLWQPMPTYLWYPGSAWNGPACLSRSSALNPPSEFASPDFTIGSLVDGKSNLFSPQSHDPGYAAASSLAAASSTPSALQVQFFPTTCGAPGFANL